jgi:sulfite reductase alpha subunit
MTRPVEELEKGRWPSYVTELKKAGYTQLVELYNKALEDKRTHFKHGGMVGYPGYDAGVIGRLSDMPEILESAHILRVIQPSGWFYKTELLRKIAEVWEKYGSGVINLMGAQGNLQLVGIETDKIEPAFEELAKLHADIGGSGPSVRTLSACAGPALCELCNIDTLAIHHELTMYYIEEIHRPRFPHKFKIKVSGCANDCLGSVARCDFAIIGTFRDAIQIDEEALKEYSEEHIQKVVSRCPTGCMSYADGKLSIAMEDCTRCMNCLNELPKALRPGKEKGVTILIGGRARGRLGAFLGWVFIPFMKVEPPYNEIKEIVDAALEWWDENGNPKERIGETIYRLGYVKFLREVGEKVGKDLIKVSPHLIVRPRANPFWRYYEKKEVE